MLAFVLLTCAIVIGFDAQHTWHDRSKVIEIGQHETADLARSLVQNAEDTIEVADASLLGLALRLAIDGTAPEKMRQLATIMAIGKTDHPAIADLIICDATGDRLASALPASTMDRSLVGREYFRYHRDHPGGELHLGPPIRGEQPGAWVIPVSRRFDHPDGSFAGLVVAAIDMAYFQRLYGTFEVGRQGSIVLARIDGTLLVRHPFVEANIGTSLLSGSFFGDHLPKSATGAAEIRSSVDGVTRLTSYHRSDRYPLAVGVSLAVDEVLAEWRADAWKHLLAVLLLAGFIALFGLRLVAQIENRQEVEKTVIAEAERLRLGEAQLRESEERFRQLFESASDWFWEQDADGRLTFVSPRHTQVTGNSTSKNYGLRREEYGDTLLDPDSWRGYLADLAARRPFRDFIYRHGRPDAGGLLRWTKTSGVPVFAEDGTFLGYRGAASDVTDEVEAAAEARNVLLRFHDALENVGSPIAIYGADERLIIANQAYKNLHKGPDGTTIIRDGITVPELMAWRIRSGFWASPPSDASNPLDGLLDQLRHPSATVSYELADGRSMLVEYRRSIDGSQVSTWTDVTAIRATEAHRRELETQLHHAQKQDALGQLAGGIAHDLNNALVPVLMMTEIAMEMHAEGSSERANLALALQGARRAKDLVQRILSFTRKEVAEKQRCDLAALVIEAMTMLRASLPATIELVTAVECVPAVFGDSGQLYQAIINLVTNAAHAIGDELGKIEVTLRSADIGSQIRLTIADSGCGMDETTKARIFDPFFTTKAVGEGTGLGLSIAHSVVVAHGGTIAVTSQPGRGSTFDIGLPIVGEQLV